MPSVTGNLKLPAKLMSKYERFSNHKGVVKAYDEKKAQKVEPLVVEKPIVVMLEQAPELKTMQILEQCSVSSKESRENSKEQKRKTPSVDTRQTATKSTLNN